MCMTLAECMARFPNRPAPAPIEYAGQWVAWNPERTAIISHGTDVAEVRDAALAAGYEEPLLQKVIARPFVGFA